MTKTKKIKLNPLYKLGMSQVGCMPCINANKNELSEIARRFPVHVEKIKEWERIIAYASKRGFASFFAGSARRSKEPLPGYVYKPDADNDDAPWVEDSDLIKARYSIEGRVAWSMTSFGGRQFDLLKTGEPPQCSSVYGLCE